MCYVHIDADAYIHVPPGPHGRKAESVWGQGSFNFFTVLTLQQVGMCLAAITASQQWVLFIHFFKALVDGGLNEL